MATLTITIPNDKVELLKKALDYQENIVDEFTGKSTPNPQGPADFAEEQIIKFLTSKAKAYERQRALLNLKETDLGATR